MNKLILDKHQITQLVDVNRYRIDNKTRLLSRCIDGRYQNVENLAPLGFPGADVGELAVIMASANSFGFDINLEKTFQSFIKVIGGEKNFQFHTDHHADILIPASGCGHFKQMKLDPDAYSMKKEQLSFISEKLELLKKQGAQETVLEGNHLEAAVLMVSGNWSVKTRYVSDEVFVFHSTLANERHKLFSKQLIKDGSVTLLNGQDEKYLYEVISQTTENHLMETAKRLAKGLPIFEIEFDDKGNYSIKDLGFVSA